MLCCRELADPRGALLTFILIYNWLTTSVGSYDPTSTAAIYAGKRVLAICERVAQDVAEEEGVRLCRCTASCDFRFCCISVATIKRLWTYTCPLQANKNAESQTHESLAFPRPPLEARRHSSLPSIPKSHSYPKRIWLLLKAYGVVCIPFHFEHLSKTTYHTRLGVALQDWCNLSA